MTGGCLNGSQDGETAPAGRMRGALKATLIAMPISLLTYYFLGDRSMGTFEAFVFPT